MRKLLQWILPAVLALTCTVASAKDVNIAFVDGNRILADYQPQIDKKLEGEFKARHAELLAMQNDLKKLVENIKKDEAVMSADEKKKKQVELENKQRDLQRKGSAYNEDISVRGNEELQKLASQIEAIIAGVAKEKKYDVVMQRGAAVFIADGMDITDEVMAKLKASKK